MASILQLLASYGSSASAYETAVLADSPLAWWKLADVSPSGAGSVDDAQGSNDATPNGGITWQSAGPLTDGSSKSALLNGTSGYITGGASVATTLMNSANWTVEFWFYSAATNGGTIFAAASDATHRVRIEHFGNTIYSTSNVGGNKSSTTAGKVTSSWHHLVLTSGGALYIDGIAQTGTSGSGNNSTNQLTIGALNNGTAFFSGRISHVAVYQSALSSTRVTAHFNAAVQHTVPTGRTFYWDMEQTTPNSFPAGGDDTPSFDQSSSLSSAQAYAGSQSLSVGGGTFRSATFDNPWSQDMWANLTEGTVRCRFRYNGSITTFMIFQITGKDRASINDTNDSIKVTITGTTAVATYSYANGASTTTVTTTVTVAADTWHYMEVKWRNSGTDRISLTINSTTNTTASTFGSTSATAWHHLLIGNDTSASPTGMWIDEFEVYGSWQ